MVSDSEVAAMVEVARSAGSGLSRDGRALLDDLIARGYIAEAAGGGPDHQRYKITTAGQAVLEERGVGANES